jgi:hypothetical protein
MRRPEEGPQPGQGPQQPQPGQAEPQSPPKTPVDVKIDADHSHRFVAEATSEEEMLNLKAVEQAEHEDFKDHIVS